MILEFSITNFRSIKETTVFSMVAEPSKSKTNNVYTQQLPTGDSVRLLNSAVIYGANGAGKSNLIRAFYEFISFILNNNSKTKEPIKFYDPYMFDANSQLLPVSFSLTFIGPQNIKYHYAFSYDKYSITEEDLIYYPNGKETILFHRPSPLTAETAEVWIHTGRLGNSLGGKEIKVFHNKLLLSKFGLEEPHEMLTPVFMRFNNYNVLNTHNQEHIASLKKDIKFLFKNNSKLHNNLNSFIQKLDIKIKNIIIEEPETFENSFPPHTHEKIKSEAISYNKYELMGMHDFFKDNVKHGEIGLNFEKESTGTNTIFYLGGKILDTLDNGGVLFVDELETSLHPLLSKILIELFHSEHTNPKGAQLVFTTHDITLLSKSIFRKDQIWFTEKDDFGKTDLFSAQDFKDAREDTPFDRWYMAGKFGALPFINAIDNTISNKENNAKE